MKATGTGYLRQAGKPNLRRQDGSKERLFCGPCEQRLCAEEAWFKSNVFDVYLSGKQTFKYDEHLFRFCVSLAWRVLITTDEKHINTTSFRSACDDISEKWRRFLLDHNNASTLPECHLFLTDVCADGKSSPVRNFSTYFARSVDSSLAYSPNRCFIYVKFARFIFLAAIEPNFINALEGTKIDPSGGTLQTPQACLDGDIGAFLMERARDSNAMFQRGLSDAQRAMINGHVAKNKARFVSSDLGRAALADHKAHVDPHLILQHPVARNDDCPCGSGRKYKNCCGKTH
ncbi:MAG: SEC-C metal-binding domain-containing protein [Tepidisphaeraceae bacterium]